jgi:uroporphyrinogen decarboxylase
MNSRERFLSLMAFAPIDRGFSYELGAWSESLARWHREGMPESVHLNEYWGFDRFDVEAHLPLLVVEPLPAFEEAMLEEDEQYIIKRHPDGHVSRSLKTGTSMDQYLSFPVKERPDFETIKRRYNPHTPARYPARWEDQRRCLAGRDYPLALTERGCFGLFSILRRWMGTELACTIFHDDPALAEEMLEFATEYFLAVIARAVTEIKIDWFQYFEDFAFKTGPLIGPNVFRRFLLPRYRRINDFLRSHGVRHIWVDSDGNTEMLLPLLIESGVTGHLPLERAAGMDPLKLRARYGHDLALLGGIDKRALAHGRRAIDDELYRHVPPVARRRRVYSDGRPHGAAGRIV